MDKIVLALLLMGISGGLCGAVITALIDVAADKVSNRPLAFIGVMVSCVFVLFVWFILAVLSR